MASRAQQAERLRIAWVRAHKGWLDAQEAGSPATRLERAAHSSHANLVKALNSRLSDRTLDAEREIVDMMRMASPGGWPYKQLSYSRFSMPFFDELNVTAIALKQEGHFQPARKIQKDLLEKTRALMGDKHPRTIERALDLAGTLGQIGDFAGAERKIEFAFRGALASYGLEDANTHTILQRLAVIRLGRRRGFDRALDAEAMQSELQREQEKVLRIYGIF